MGHFSFMYTRRVPIFEIKSEYRLISSAPTKHLIYLAMQARNWITRKDYVVQDASILRQRKSKNDEKLKRQKRLKFPCILPFYPCRFRNWITPLLKESLVQDASSLHQRSQKSIRNFKSRNGLRFPVSMCPLHVDTAYPWIHHFYRKIKILLYYCN